MIRQSRALGAAVIAVLALSAVVASAANATNFTASKYPTAATASSAKGNDDLKTEAGSVECNAHFAMAALGEASETITVTPTYTECQAFGFLSATMSMNGCDYVYHTNESMDIQCPAFGQIQIVASTCEMTIGTQWGLPWVSLYNSGFGIAARINASLISYTVTKDGFLCPFKGTGFKSGAATYQQNFAIQFSSTNGATIDIG